MNEKVRNYSTGAKIYPKIEVWIDQINRVMCKSTVAIFVIGLFLAFSTCPAFASGNSWQQYLRQGELELSRKNVVVAEGCFQRALAKIERVPHNTYDLVICLNKLANALALENKTGAAATLYQRSISLLEQARLQKSAKMLETLIALGSISEALGDPNSAMKLYHRAMSINECNFGPYDPAVAGGLNTGQSPAGSARAYAKSAGPSRSDTLTLMQDPGLEASHQLVRMVEKKHCRDLLSDGANTDQSLLADFKRQMLEPTAEAQEADKILGGSLPLEALEPSKKM